MTEPCKLLGKLGSDHANTAHALDALEDDGAHVVFLQFGFPRTYLVQGKIADVTVLVDGRNDFRVLRDFNGKRGAAVECFLGREDAGAAVVKRSQLQRILVGLGSAVDKKQLIVGVAGDAAEPFGKVALQGVDDRVGVESELFQLTADFMDVVRMGVADADDGMTAIEIEVFLPLVVPHVAALSAHNIDVE